MYHAPLLCGQYIVHVQIRECVCVCIEIQNVMWSASHTDKCVCEKRDIQRTNLGNPMIDHRDCAIQLDPQCHFAGFLLILLRITMSKHVIFMLETAVPTLSPLSLFPPPPWKKKVTLTRLRKIAGVLYRSNNCATCARVAVYIGSK